MKINKRSWHYRFLTWAMGYPAETNIFGHNTIFQLPPEQRGVASYYYNLVAHIVGLPLILLSRGLTAIFDAIDEWTTNHKVEVEN